jgi:hypothetical protein
MTSIDEIYEQYSEIGDRLRALSNAGFSVIPCGQGVEINLPNTTSALRLGRKELDLLDYGELITDVPQLRYHQDCGISFRSYSEFFITIDHPYYVFLDLPSDWPGSVPLRFKIGYKSISAGPASPLIILLMEPHFFDSDFHFERFSSFASVRILGASRQSAASYLHKALYYMNSYYLKPAGLVASLRHVNPTFDDPLGLYSGTNEPEEAFKKIVRRRVRQRKDFLNVEPLLLYNHACQSSGTEAFLSFYRVLEFFFTRSILAAIDSLRHNPTASAQDIVNVAIARNEEQQLKNLLSSVLTASQKKKLSNYAYSQSLTDNVKFPALVKGMYTFRNSLVHAKEKELQKTTLPDPFLSMNLIQKWTYIIAVCAERAIKVMNSK